MVLIKKRVNKWFRKEYYKSFEAEDKFESDIEFISNVQWKEYNTDDLIQAFLKKCKTWLVRLYFEEYNEYIYGSDVVGLMCLKVL
jgi:hypothetical protein